MKLALAKMTLTHAPGLLVSCKAPIPAVQAATATVYAVNQRCVMLWARARPTKSARAISATATTKRYDVITTPSPMMYLRLRLGQPPETQQLWLCPARRYSRQ